jgi:transmembrane protein 132
MGNVNGTKDVGGCGAGGTKPLSEEPTMNAHDWVWLGRSTLERSSGMLVPSIGNKSHNNNNNNSSTSSHVNEQNMRIMSNPIYGVDNVNSNSNCGNQQQQACGRNSPPPINTSTYSVKDRLSNGNIVFNKLWKV